MTRPATPPGRPSTPYKWLLLILLTLTACTATWAAPAIHLQVQGAITPASADYMVRGIHKANQNQSPLVIIEIDTPGGLDTAMRDVIRAILASRIPVAVYVSPQGARAASAGTFILYAAHLAAMAPATTLGAATPVAIGFPGADKKPDPDRTGKDHEQAKDKAEPRSKSSPRKDLQEANPTAPPADAMTAKQVNDAAAFIRGLAVQRGRNAEWAERAVREAVSLTASEALQQNVIDVVATDIPNLLQQINGRTVRVDNQDIKLATGDVTTESVPPDWRQRLLAVITNPSLALILMMIGIYGLLFEFSTPGFGIAGTAGAISLLLALFALQMLPVNYAGLALILLGMALIVAELFTPTFGVLGVGGVAAFVAGGLLLFDRDIPGFGVPVGLIVALAICTAALVLVGGNMALKARRRPVVTGAEGMVGASGVVLLHEAGDTWALVQGERWKVRSRQRLAPGQSVRVLGMQGLVLDVLPDPDTNQQQGL